jgi:hypothetical protein
VLEKHLKSFSNLCRLHTFLFFERPVAGYLVKNMCTGQGRLNDLLKQDNNCLEYLE